jgi:hypothetical protein
MVPVGADLVDSVEQLKQGHSDRKYRMWHFYASQSFCSIGWGFEPKIQDRLLSLEP